MAPHTRLTTVETVHEEGSWLFTIEDRHGDPEEVILVPCEGEGEEVEAWINICPHEAQRLDPGFGATIREEGIVCPRHGSMFEPCNGDCDNGKAAGTTLRAVETTVELGSVYLTDADARYLHDSGIKSGDGGGDDGDVPGSTSHIGF